MLEWVQIMKSGIVLGRFGTGKVLNDLMVCFFYSYVLNYNFLKHLFISIRTSLM